MAATPPEQRIWWNEPIERVELVWIIIAFLWGLFMFGFMIAWHFIGQQNLSKEAYRIAPSAYEAKVDEFAKKFQVREEQGIPVVKPQPGTDVYLLGRLWQWWPILELEKGVSYRIHLSSIDWLHGFSLQPVNINIQVHPGYEHVISLTPTQSGEFGIICNEFCGIGHHTMTGKIYVTEQKRAEAEARLPGGGRLMTAETVIGAVPAQAEFRTCQYTGLKVDTAAQALIKANAVAAVVFLAIGGLMGLLVALTRWPAVHLLPADWFYLILTGHGANVLLFWIIFFEIAVLYFASAILLSSRIAAPKLAWVGFVMMVVGAIATNVAVLQGDSSVMFTSYPPMKAQPHFYLGLILFAVGALIGCVIFFATLAIAKDEKTYEGSIPLVTFGALTAAIIAVFTIASGAIILIPTWLWSLGLISDIDSLMYRVVWWAMGHSSQQINVSAHVSLWYLTAALLVGAKPLEREGEPYCLLHVHPVSAARFGAPSAGRSRAGCELEDRQHQLHDVSGRARLDGSRSDRAGSDRSGAAQERLQSRRVRMAAQGAVGTSGLRRHVPVAGVLRFHRRHLRRRARHRAAQRADA